MKDQAYSASKLTEILEEQWNDKAKGAQSID